MDKITSFTIDHNKLQPGIYVSRKDKAGDATITTFDLRMTSPNEEPVIQTAELHTIEHLGATYLRIHSGQGENVLYFGPMGCRTGFYLLMAGDLESRDILPMITNTFEYIRDFEGEVPGASPRDCGNYLDMNLGMAKYVAENNRLVLLQPFEIGQEIVLPFHPVVQSCKAVLGVGGIAGNHVVFRELSRYDTPLGIVFLHTDPICHGNGLLPGKYSSAGISLFPRIIPVLVISGKVQFDLSLLQLALLDAEHIRIHSLEEIQEPLSHAGSEPIYIPRNQFRHYITSFLSCSHFISLFRVIILCPLIPDI